jgi:hypothetical protein
MLSGHLFWLQSGHLFGSDPATLFRVAPTLSLSAIESQHRPPHCGERQGVRCLSRERRCERLEKS